jgi:hypothetical protein
MIIAFAFRKMYSSRIEIRSEKRGYYDEKKEKKEKGHP